MKTKPMEHQVRALQAMQWRKYFALLMEMGTGKTWTLLADAERSYEAGKIDALVVMAPKGVHTNWTRREIPEHLSCPHVCYAWNGKQTLKERKKWEAFWKTAAVGEIRPLRIFAINTEAVRTARGFKVVQKFLQTFKAMLCVDESIRIANPDSLTTKQAYKLADLGVCRRILNGSPTGGHPGHLFGQFEFLEPGLLGTSSYRAFMAEFAELLPPTNNLVIHAKKASGGRAEPQIVAKDRFGNKKWRNIDKLREMVDKHSFRVRKADCLDLPPKIYTQRYFELTPAMERAYRLLHEEARIEFGEDIVTVAPLAVLTKLQQVAAGFVNVDKVPLLIEPENNPRMALLKECLEEVEGSVIIWCRFKEEIRQVVDALRKWYPHETVVQYHGAISAQDREDAQDFFQVLKARFFVGQAQAGGLGLTLTAAETVIYYSQDFNLITRIQSEDRAHRKGTRKNVTYIDLIAEDTVDEGVSRSLRNKAVVAGQLAGD